MKTLNFVIDGLKSLVNNHPYISVKYAYRKLAQIHYVQIDPEYMEKELGLNKEIECFEDLFHKKYPEEMLVVFFGEDEFIKLDELDWSYQAQFNLSVDDLNHVEVLFFKFESYRSSSYLNLIVDWGGKKVNPNAHSSNDVLALSA